jgi:hypothetical protein
LWPQVALAPVRRITRRLSGFKSTALLRSAKDGFQPIGRLLTPVSPPSLRLTVEIPAKNNFNTANPFWRLSKSVIVLAYGGIERRRASVEISEISKHLLDWLT